MKILSISTSSNIASVAISENDQCLLELNIDNNKTHSETIIPLIQKLFSQSKMSLSDINLIACDVGPGSFTGIRIGIATAKSIAETIKTPLVDVSSLEALAYNVQDLNCKTICSIIDARNNQVYCGIFDNQYHLLEDYLADDINNVINSIKKYNNTIFIGDGAIIHKNILKISNFNFENILHAKNIAKCAYYKYKQNYFQTADSIKPLYLKKSQAERMKKKND